MEQTKRSCDGCVFALRQDQGYSNWTVTSTEWSCLKGLNPGMPVDDYGSDKTFTEVLSFATTCDDFCEGRGAWLDVDGEAGVDEYRDDPVIGQYFRAWENRE